VGYVGKDVDAIIRDLAEMAVKQTREAEMKKVRTRAEDAAEERILDVLIPQARTPGASRPPDSTARQVFRKKLREGQLDDKEIEIDLADSPPAAGNHGPSRAWRKWPSSCVACSARWAGQAQDPQAQDRRGPEAAHRRGGRQAGERRRDQAPAPANAEQNGIVFIDEIDKVASRQETSGAEVSRQGVQRDLLPLVEGTTVSTKYGMVKTDHILFIASGAFHLSKPSDLIPELQGRFPIRVELESLSVQDFEAILTQTMPRWSSSTRRCWPPKG
jgi:ATP-dependent HslUV protease ATP-binding subunit HslU